MAEKYEWKKMEKGFYNPGRQPQFVDVPSFQYFILSGKGNPNDAFFAEYVQCLYSLSYSAKMRWKKEKVFDYAVYPLEGVWSMQSEASITNGILNKNDLVFNLMIRQPDFISEEYAAEIIESVKIKKPHPLLEQVAFESISEGRCVQMLHIGSYDNEPATFAEMASFAEAYHLSRISSVHREIYLSDARKVQPEKLKTILRFQVG